MQTQGAEAVQQLPTRLGRGPGAVGSGQEGSRLCSGRPGQWHCPQQRRDRDSKGELGAPARVWGPPETERGGRAGICKVTRTVDLGCKRLGQSNLAPVSTGTYISG